MQFLLTNDDGYGAIGLNLLAEVCEAHGAVTILAPDQEQSGVGHRVNTRGALRVVQHAAGRYTLAGTPADCTRIALRGLGFTPNWVLSGLNHGGNLGVDIHMSGTVAAAREAAILGVPAIAISQVLDQRHPFRQERVQRITARLIQYLLSKPLALGKLYNVNLPFAPESEEPEIVFCPPDPCPHDVRYERAGDEFSYSGVFLNRPRVPGSDVSTIIAGKIAVSELAIV